MMQEIKLRNVIDTTSDSKNIWNDPWEIFSLADAYKERPPTVYIVEGFFRLPSLNILYGAPGSLKSLLLADLGLCVASGSDWLPSAEGANATPFKTVQAPVLWVDFDNGKDLTHERIEALARARNLPETTPFNYVSMPQPWLNALNSMGINNLILRVLDLKAKLICIDNLGVISGKADENSGEMIAVMSNLRQVTEKTGACLVIIHHERKSTGFNSRAGESVRGHSSIEGAINMGYRVERPEYSDKITIKSTKSRERFVEPFGAVFTYEQKDNNDLLKAKFYGMGIDQDLHTLSIIREIKSLLENGPILKTKLALEVSKALPKVGTNRVRSVIEVMGAKNEIQIVSAPNGGKLCSK